MTAFMAEIRNVCKAGVMEVQQRTSPRKEEEAQTYSVQMHVDLTASIYGGFFASQLCDLAQDADCAVGELLQIGGVDTRSLFGHYVYSR